MIDVENEVVIMREVSRGVVKVFLIRLNRYVMSLVVFFKVVIVIRM